MHVHVLPLNDLMILALLIGCAECDTIAKIFIGTDRRISVVVLFRETKVPEENPLVLSNMVTICHLMCQCWGSKRVDDVTAGPP